jgi:hypothetical protein
MREKRCAKATMSTSPSKFSKEWVRRMADTASGPIDSCRLLPIIMYTSAVICYSDDDDDDDVPHR